MKSCYVDIHIHTSENAGHLNENYDVETLKKKIESISKENPYLISLTDHNIINIKAYQDLLNAGMNFIVGVELHIRTYKECSPYHCHFLFDIPDEIMDVVIQEAFITGRMFLSSHVKNTALKDLYLPFNGASSLIKQVKFQNKKRKKEIKDED